MLERVSPGPVVTLNHAVAVAMVHGPLPALAMLGTLDADERMAGNHRVDAVRAHLLEMAGDPNGARGAYLAAARLTQSIPEQRYLTDRAARLDAAARLTPSLPADLLLRWAHRLEPPIQQQVVDDLQAARDDERRARERGAQEQRTRDEW